MESIQSTAPEIQPISKRTEPYDRGEVLVRLEVDCRPSTYPGPDGYLLQAGKQIIKISKREVPWFLALVEPEPEEIERARRLYTSALHKFLEEETRPGMTAEQCAALVDVFPHSVEHFFQRDKDRGILPFNSVRIVEDGISAPADESARDQQVQMAEHVALAVAKALNARSPSQDDIQALVQKLVAAELEKLTGGDSKAPVKAEPKKS